MSFKNKFRYKYNMLPPPSSPPPYDIANEFPAHNNAHFGSIPLPPPLPPPPPLSMYNNSPYNEQQKQRSPFSSTRKKAGNKKASNNNNNAQNAGFYSSLLNTVHHHPVKPLPQKRLPHTRTSSIRSNVKKLNWNNHDDFYSSLFGSL